MRRVLLIGYGNPLCGDDGIGCHAADILAGEHTENPVSVLACRQLTPDLAEPVSLADRVIFVDASVDDAPGHIRTRHVEPGTAGTSAFSHEITPEALLGWTRHLYGAAPEAILVTIGARNLDIGSGYSPEVAGALPALLALIRELF
jgi:hydrogenase maturation protease